MPSLNKLFKIAIFLLSSLALQCYAAVITYKVNSFGGGYFSYDYIITSEIDDPLIQEFSIFFDYSLYANLTITSSPGAWDSILIAPDAALGADGFFDSLNFTGLAPGNSQGGFTVNFEYLGAGLPGAQRFDIVDPGTFATISTGITTAAGADPIDIPEPSILRLGVFSLLIPLFLRRKQTGE